MIDTLLVEERYKAKSFKVETPLGSMESDSGNHVIDIISVVAVIGILYLAKHMLGRYFK